VGGETPEFKKGVEAPARFQFSGENKEKIAGGRNMTSVWKGELPSITGAGLLNAGPDPIEALL